MPTPPKPPKSPPLPPRAAPKQPKAPNTTGSPIDQAYDQRLAGNLEGALRTATAVAEAEPAALDAFLLATACLVESKRDLFAAEACAGLVDGFARRGDLPAAIVAAKLADGAEAGAGAALVEGLAALFAKGSARLGDVAPSPPPMTTQALGPKELAATGLAALKGEKLFDRAEEALRKLLGRAQAAPDYQVPKLPLFAELEGAALGRFINALQVRVVPAGSPVFSEGDEGRALFFVSRGLLEVSRTADGAPQVLAHLGPGAIFGEMALVSDTPRAASVSALGPATLLSVDRATLEKMAAQEPTLGRELARFCRERMLANLLSHSPMFQAVQASHRTRLLEHFTLRSFDAGACVVQRGEPSPGLYLLATGGVQVRGRDADDDTVVLAELGPGDVVGEISLVLRRPANADVIARHPTMALELKSDDFQSAIREHPTLLNQLYELATQREEEARTVVAQQALQADDLVII